jgi:hypothetical protein
MRDPCRFPSKRKDWRTPTLARGGVLLACGQRVLPGNNFYCCAVCSSQAHHLASGLSVLNRFQPAKGEPPEAASNGNWRRFLAAAHRVYQTDLE